MVSRSTTKLVQRDWFGSLQKPVVLCKTAMDLHAHLRSSSKIHGDPHPHGLRLLLRLGELHVQICHLILPFGSQQIWVCWPNFSRHLMFQVPWNKMFHVKSKLIAHSAPNPLDSERFQQEKSERGWFSVLQWVRLCAMLFLQCRFGTLVLYTKFLGCFWVCVLEEAVWSGLCVQELRVPCRNQLSLFHSQSPQSCWAPLLLCLMQAPLSYSLLKGDFTPGTKS